MGREGVILGYTYVWRYDLIFFFKTPHFLHSAFSTPHFPHYAFSTLRIFHSAFSTLLIFYTPHFLHSAFSTLCIIYTPHFPHSAFSTLRNFHTPRFPHSALRTPRFPLNRRRAKRKRGRKNARYHPLFSPGSLARIIFAFPFCSR